MSGLAIAAMGVPQEAIAAPVALERQEPLNTQLFSPSTLPSELIPAPGIPQHLTPLDSGADPSPAYLAQQSDPDDRFLQDPPDLTLPTDDEPVLQPEVDPSPPTGLPDQPDVQFPIRTLEVLGSTIFDQQDFAPIIQPLENQTVTLADLQQAADAITQLYLNDGYLTSRAILVDQPITDGIVRIQVVEGSLAEIQIEGLQRLRQRYVRDRIELGAGTPLRAERLEEQLRLLRSDPLFDNIEASLRASGEVGQSVLIVRVDEASPWFGGASVDNYSPPSVGSERVGVDIGHRNVTGLGDSLSLSYDRTTRGGAHIFDINYRVPLNPMNGTLALRTVIDRNEIVQSPFNVFGIRGESERYEISFRQPLVRSTREEFALSLGFSHKDGQTFLFNNIPQPFGIGPDEDGISRTSVFRLGQDYVRRDVAGAWALRSQFNIGVDVLNATTNSAPVPDSRFVSWLGQVQRVQRLGDDHLMILQADLQLSPDSLLASEQFVIGGGQSVRGFRQNARSGDNGFRVSLEDRITLTRNASGLSVFQLAPFIDMGAVWNHPDNPNTLPDQTFLVGAGLGALWELVPNLNLRLDYALPLIDLSDRGNNFQDDGLYFSVDYRF
ncbi:MAG: ShlB/FhaC/HecB family hemolysin secretion/activation protein [Leptolyngbya sp. DLM2.Bin15]|nr:MAG: ShlB/FhaC/HecB family hemolysin secretion/activation protein [Leptolyngbya sp. DLM2.Bin15]